MRLGLGVPADGTYRLRFRFSDVAIGRRSAQSDAELLTRFTPGCVTGNGLDSGTSAQIEHVNEYLHSSVSQKSSPLDISPTHVRQLQQLNTSRFSCRVLINIACLHHFNSFPFCDFSISLCSITMWVSLRLGFPFLESASPYIPRAPSCFRAILSRITFQPLASKKKKMRCCHDNSAHP